MTSQKMIFMVKVIKSVGAIDHFIKFCNKEYFTIEMY
jgi:hypothetical protein